ncbi:hypothetical protein B0H63DRAFT_132086 [Podospora didyma]|uniref:Uncharacterized protein n=1 Tax=Podospora didyma TaxID=330526 RepID=A0AAE0P0G4_9PEZI|nr:hypothetical protein B0H63DRAFT_132086 [Podospora didyma]
MMATESPKERSDEATVTSDNEPAIQIDTDSHNVNSDHPHVNGDGPASAGTDEVANKHILDIVDDLVHSSEVSISGGSDNEASRGDAKHKDDAKGHVRTSSTVKKPASFKAISVNKTFLTTKGAAPSAPPKPTDKATTAASSAPSAQSGSLAVPRPRLVAKTGSGLVTKSSTGVNGGKTAPDPSAVWNKNRPVPPPEPKKYTDEELKKYGIHMATRLAPDDPKGQGHANWADIDDDDEDWAPETITWQDGTKVTIPHTEEPAPPPEPAPRPVAVAPPLAPVAVKENGIVEKPKSPAPPSTISPAPPVKTAVLGSGKGLILKGVQEKPTLVAKPPAPPTPVKSPWAPIPKVDKVPPVVIDILSQQTARQSPRDVPIAKSSTPPPPKEIAADDFSRAAWRDGNAGGNRELFNSQSGRYEPAPDRRGSRPDAQHNRQPAVLQRTSLHDQQAPAEPSAAFQTNRTSDQLSYGRRRGSSNVSGGSGSLMRRLGAHDLPMPPPELVNARRGSTTGETDSPASPRNFSPSGLQGGPRHGQNWPTRQSPAMSHSTPYHQSAQGQVAPPVQQPALVPLVTEDDFELQKRLMRERRELAMKRRLEQEAREEAEKQERIRLKLEALGPPPESSKAKKALKDQATTPTQIQPRENLPAEETTSTKEQKAAEKPAVESAVSEQSNKTDSLPNGPSAQALPSAEPIDARPQHGSTHAHPWPTTKQPELYTTPTWGAQPTPVTAKNVWGSPNNNRSLGNGTFITDLGTGQLGQLPAKAGPGPIAPPSAAAARQPPIAPPKIAPRHERGAMGELSASEREAKQSAWANTVRLGDNAFQSMLDVQYKERERRLQKEGRTLTEIQPAIKDTWRPTKLDDSGVRAESATKQTVKVGQENPWAGPSETKPSSSQPAMSVSSTTPSEHGQRAQSAAAGRDGASASILPTTAPQQSPSPPPPDMAGHPAFDGDVTHPLVSLPPPQPRVRLPPAPTTAARADAPETTSAHSAPSTKSQGPLAWASTAAYKDHDTATTANMSRASVHDPGNSWQAKIDSLLGGRKTHTPPKTSNDYASRNPYEHPGRSLSSRSIRPALAAKDALVTTKDMAEECFEEQEMGSLPPVRLPNVVPEMLWQPSPAPKRLPKSLYIEPSTANMVDFKANMSGGGIIWRVFLPYMDGSKDITVPFGRTRSNPRRATPRGARHPSGPHRPTKGRESSSSYSHDQGAGPSASGSTSSQQTRNSRGGYRGRDNWTRNSAAPIQT